MSERVQALTVLRAALAVECDACWADPGEPCYDDEGQEYVPIHPQRVERLNDHVAEAEALYDAQDGEA